MTNPIWIAIEGYELSVEDILLFGLFIVTMVLLAYVNYMIYIPPDPSATAMVNLFLEWFLSAILGVFFTIFLYKVWKREHGK